MKCLILEYRTEKGKEAINKCIQDTKKDIEKGKLNTMQQGIASLYRFDDGIFKVVNIDPHKLTIFRMFLKPAFKKAMKKEGCSKDDYRLELIDEV